MKELFSERNVIRAIVFLILCVLFENKFKIIQYVTIRD